MKNMFKKIRKIVYMISTIMEKNKSSVLLLVFIGIISDIFFISKSSDLLIFSILALYIFSSLIYKLKSKIAYFTCLLLLSLLFVLFLLSGPSDKTEKTAVWLVLFMLVGIIQQWRE